MGKQKVTKKFAAVKRLLNPKDIRMFIKFLSFFFKKYIF